jgi:outer membrane protein assembly factor BamE
MQLLTRYHSANGALTAYGLSMNKITLALALLLGGCSMTNPIQALKPYQIDIQQGNEVTQAMLDQLKPGMTPAQVRFVMGTPLVVDPFHADRWDYVLRVEKAGRLIDKRRVTVVFRDGVLLGIESGGPAGTEQRQGGTP